jgi:DNA-binding transcriptional LysR family regulator
MSSVELREIRVFLTLAEELHFGRTAERLQITHSRVSQTIRTLEVRIGARLFDRTSRRVQLTPIGVEFQRRIAPAYEDIQRIYGDLHERATGIAGTLRLGVYASSIAEPHALEIIKTFEARHPECRVQVTETGLGRDPFEWLRRNELDVIVMRMPVTDPDLTVGPALASEERVLAVAADHPLAAHGSVSVEDLADYTTTDAVIAPREIMDVFSPPRTPSGRPIRRAALRSISEAAVRVATGELVHPTVPAFFKAYPHPGVVSVPIRDLAPATLALVWLNTNHSPRIQAFAEAATGARR